MKSKNGRWEVDACSTHYSVKLSIPEFEAVNDDDDDIIGHDDRDDDKTLCQRLDAIDGVFDSDFNGHFGPVIFFTIEFEHNNSDTWDEIYKHIEQSIASGLKVDREQVVW